MSNILAITYEDAVAITASDATADPAGPFAGIYTGSGGDIKITTRSGAVVLKSTPAGVIMPLWCSRVWSTGTAATNVLGMLALPFKGAAIKGT
jgi:hypothetical protein